jgi:hypothetical protein
MHAYSDQQEHMHAGIASQPVDTAHRFAVSMHTKRRRGHHGKQRQPNPYFQCMTYLEMMYISESKVPAANKHAWDPLPVSLITSLEAFCMRSREDAEKRVFEHRLKTSIKKGASSIRSRRKGTLSITSLKTDNITVKRMRYGRTDSNLHSNT